MRHVCRSLTIGILLAMASSPSSFGQVNKNATSTPARPTVQPRTVVQQPVQVRPAPTMQQQNTVTTNRPAANFNQPVGTMAGSTPQMAPSAAPTARSGLYEFVRPPSAPMPQPTQPTVRPAAPANPSTPSRSPSNFSHPSGTMAGSTPQMMPPAPQTPRGNLYEFVRPPATPLPQPTQPTARPVAHPVNTVTPSRSPANLNQPAGTMAGSTPQVMPAGPMVPRKSTVASNPTASAGPSTINSTSNAAAKSPSRSATSPSVNAAAGTTKSKTVDHKPAAVTPTPNSTPATAARSDTTASRSKTEPVIFVQSGSGAKLTAEQVKSGSFPKGTFFTESSTGRKLTQKEIGGSPPDSNPRTKNATLARATESASGLTTKRPDDTRNAVSATPKAAFDPQPEPKSKLTTVGEGVVNTVMAAGKPVLSAAPYPINAIPAVAGYFIYVSDLPSLKSSGTIGVVNYIAPQVLATGARYAGAAVVGGTALGPQMALGAVGYGSYWIGEHFIAPYVAPQLGAAMFNIAPGLFTPR